MGGYFSHASDSSDKTDEEKKHEKETLDFTDIYDEEVDPTTPINEKDFKDFPVNENSSPPTNNLEPLENDTNTSSTHDVDVKKKSSESEGPDPPDFFMGPVTLYHASKGRFEMPPNKNWLLRNKKKKSKKSYNYNIFSFKDERDVYDHINEISQKINSPEKENLKHVYLRQRALFYVFSLPFGSKDFSKGFSDIQTCVRMNKNFFRGYHTRGVYYFVRAFDLLKQKVKSTSNVIKFLNLSRREFISILNGQDGTDKESSKMHEIRIDRDLCKIALRNLIFLDSFVMALHDLKPYNNNYDLENGIIASLRQPIILRMRLKDKTSFVKNKEWSNDIKELSYISLKIRKSKNLTIKSAYYCKRSILLMRMGFATDTAYSLWNAENAIKLDPMNNFAYNVIGVLCATKFELEIGALFLDEELLIKVDKIFFNRQIEFYKYAIFAFEQVERIEKEFDEDNRNNELLNEVKSNVICMNDMVLRNIVNFMIAKRNEIAEMFMKMIVEVCSNVKKEGEEIVDKEEEGKGEKMKEIKSIISKWKDDDKLKTFMKRIEKLLKEEEGVLEQEILSNFPFFWVMFFFPLNFLYP